MVVRLLQAWTAKSSLPVSLVSSSTHLNPIQPSTLHPAATIRRPEQRQPDSSYDRATDLSRSIGCQATISSSRRTRCLKIDDVTSLLVEPGSIQLPWVFSLHGCCLNFESITRSKKRSNCNRTVIRLVCKRTPANFHEFTAVSNEGNGEIGRAL